MGSWGAGGMREQGALWVRWSGVTSVSSRDGNWCED